MYFKTLVILTLVCVCYSDNLNETTHIRVKRGKYYSSPPLRVYRIPPKTYPTKGVYYLTPPPGYLIDDDEPPYPRKPKVSRRPEGLGDEDINNFVKYLSKQDLDKIIEFAGEKERIKDNSIETKAFKRQESRIDKANVQEFTDQAYSQHGAYQTQDYNQKFNLNGPFRSQEQEFKLPHKFQTNSNQFAVPPYQPQGNNQLFKEPYAPNDDLQNNVEEATQYKVVYENNYPNSLKSDDSMQNKQISYLDPYIHHEINDMTGSGPANVFTDSHIMREETLPKPLNLREDDYEISYTNNVPAVVKGPSYEVKNFGDLPLMSNNYKLDTVSSYKVPHYTVTSNSKYGAPTTSQNVPIEAAPPVSEAKEQSDAHLKAIKIWTHRSKGTAYTLHNDGTLSLEWPPKPKTKYGP